MMELAIVGIVGGEVRGEAARGKGDGNGMPLSICWEVVLDAPQLGRKALRKAMIVGC